MLDCFVYHARKPGQTSVGLDGGVCGGDYFFVVVVVLVVVLSVISMMVMGLSCWIVLSITLGNRVRLVLGLMAVSVAAIISLLAPLMWTSWRPSWLPWPLESYIN